MEEELLISLIANHDESEALRLMKVAESYYKNDNDIKDRKHTYYDDSGGAVEDTIISNTKLSHPIFAKLVDQKVNYILSKEITVTSAVKNKEYEALLNTYFDTSFDRKLKGLGTSCILSAIAWLQVYYDEEGVFSTKRIPSEEVIPIWEDGDHVKLRGVMRCYFEKDDDEERSVELYTKSGVEYFTYKDEKLTKMSSGGHLTVIQNGEVYDADFGRIPIIPFKYNSREVPLIKNVKSLIDDYDFISSDLSNTLRDNPNAIKIVRNYRASDSSKFIENLKTKRVLFVEEGGDVTNLQTTVDIAATEAHLTRLRADIYDAGQGVDAQQASMGNTSGVAIRLRYSDLDMCCQSMAAEFAAALEELVYFINLDSIAKGTGDFTQEKVKFTFNTDIAINETETIDNCVKSIGIISDRTVIANHPWSDDIDVEIEQRDGEFSKLDDDGLTDTDKADDMDASEQSEEV